jgi:hypothetical protein
VRLHFQPIARHTCTVKLTDPTISAKTASLRCWYGASIAHFLVSSSESSCTRGGACPELVEWVSRRYIIALLSEMRYDTSVQFEFDPWKSENNKAKHFQECQNLWI